MHFSLFVKTDFQIEEGWTFKYLLLEKKRLFLYLFYIKKLYTKHTKTCLKIGAPMHPLEILKACRSIILYYLDFHLIYKFFINLALEDDLFGLRKFF